MILLLAVLLKFYLKYSLYKYALKGQCRSAWGITPCFEEVNLKPCNCRNSCLSRNNYFNVFAIPLPVKTGLAFQSFKENTAIY